jgi:aminopeptidase N
VTTGASWKSSWEQGGSLKVDLSHKDYDKAGRAGLPGEYCYIFTVYSGGASFLYELRKVMGEDDFKALVQEWYSSNQNKEVTTKQFLELVVKKAGKEKVNDLLTKYFSPENIPAQKNTTQSSRGYLIPLSHHRTCRSAYGGST